MFYPVTIIMDRYGGTYSGAEWTAWNRDEVPYGASSDDASCMEFWAIWDQSVGKGHNPNDAWQDLQQQLENRDDERI